MNKEKYVLVNCPVWETKLPPYAQEKLKCYTDYEVKFVKKHVIITVLLEEYETVERIQRTIDEMVGQIKNPAHRRALVKHFAAREQPKTQSE